MVNAKVVGDWLYVRDSEGNIIPNHYVSDGDEITVLDVSYSKQLALVEYPTSSGARQGYVTNAITIIKYLNEGNYINGCESQNVCDDNGTKIGSLDAGEVATILYEKGDLVHVVYNTDKGINTKSGFVKRDPSANAESSINSGYISNELVNFVKSYEGFYDHSYNDGTGVQTIGYGTTRADRVAIGTCTEEQATEWLCEEINNMAGIIKNDLNNKGVELNQNQFDALCSFAYNCGTSGLINESNLYRRICEGVRDESLRENFRAWSKAGGSVMQGLLNRRNEECDMFLYADYERNL